MFHAHGARIVHTVRIYSIFNFLRFKQKHNLNDRKNIFFPIFTGLSFRQFSPHAITELMTETTQKKVLTPAQECFTVSPRLIDKRNGKEGYKMNTKHTPGPWKVSAECCIKPGHYSIHHNGPIAYTSDAGVVGDGLANARLIAAAPEMLAALRKMLIAGPVAEAIPQDDYNRIREIIANATGEAA